MISRRQSRNPYEGYRKNDQSRGVINEKYESRKNERIALVKHSAFQYGELTSRRYVKKCEEFISPTCDGGKDSSEGVIIPTSVGGKGKGVIVISPTSDGRKGKGEVVINP